MWSVEERLFHINYLELKAAFLALHVFASQKRNAHILLQHHGYSLREQAGGTHSQTLSNLAIQVWEWCLNRKLTIQAENIPGRENEGTDRNSGRVQTPATGCYTWKIFRELNTRWGRFDVDLFAVRLTRFFSYHLDPLAWQSMH